MRRPPVHEWAVLGENEDPVPGDPDAVAILGQALRDTAEDIRREAREVQALASVESWKSKAADRFRDTAAGAVDTLRKAYHRYDVASRAMGTQIREAGDADWASALEQAQQMAAKALREAQAADAEHHAAQGKLDQLPHDDPAAAGLHHAQTAAGQALAKARTALRAAKELRDHAAQRAASRIHRAITHDGLHDGTWDKLGNDVDTVLSDGAELFKEVGETAINDLATLGNAIYHELPGLASLLFGLAEIGVGAGGEVLGFALDATGAGTILGVPVNIACAGLLTTGTALALAGGAGIAYSVSDSNNRVNLFSNDGGGGGAASEPDYTHPSNEPDPKATPRGTRTKLEGSGEMKRGLGRENEAADTLAKAGYDVEQNPDVPGEKNPDYRVEGRIFDCYSPKTANLDTIYDKMGEKVKSGQADRLVLNTVDTSADPAELRAVLERKPIRGLKEVILIDGDGNVIHFYP
jgi:hypothetical protein